jgi:hypothetical protein
MLPDMNTSLILPFRVSFGRQPLMKSGLKEGSHHPWPRPSMVLIESIAMMLSSAHFTVLKDLSGDYQHTSGQD